MTAKLIKDIFSCLKESELPLCMIEKLFLDDYSGKQIPEGYTIIRESMPVKLDENQKSCVKELISEGKKVAFLMMDGRIVAVIGYCEAKV